MEVRQDAGKWTETAERGCPAGSQILNPGNVTERGRRKSSQRKHLSRAELFKDTFYFRNTSTVYFGNQVKADSLCSMLVLKEMMNNLYRITLVPLRTATLEKTELATCHLDNDL